MRNLGCDLDRDWVLVRTMGETEVGDVWSTIARLGAFDDADGDSRVRDCDTDAVTDTTLGVDSVLDAGREITPILDAGRDADSVLDAGRDAEDCANRGVDFDADHGRDMSRRRDSDVRAWALYETPADADFPVKSVNTSYEQEYA